MSQSGGGEKTKAQEIKDDCKEPCQGTVIEIRHSTDIPWTAATTQSTGSQTRWDTFNNRHTTNWGYNSVHRISNEVRHILQHTYHELRLQLIAQDLKLGRVSLMHHSVQIVDGLLVCVWIALLASSRTLSIQTTTNITVVLTHALMISGHDYTGCNWRRVTLPP